MGWTWTHKEPKESVFVFEGSLLNARAISNVFEGAEGDVMKKSLLPSG